MVLLGMCVESQFLYVPNTFLFLTVFSIKIGQTFIEHLLPGGFYVFTKSLATGEEVEFLGKNYHRP